MSLQAETTQQSFGLDENTMDNCQLTKHSLVERGLEALEKGLAADCKFLVGKEREEIVACKVLLAITSPVFEKQFYGSIGEKDPVELLDIEPGVFKKMLQFIYSRRVGIVSREEALDLIKVAHKYWIYDLIKICMVYYLDNLDKKDMKGLCDILNVSVLYDLEIKDMVIRGAQQNTDLLLKSKEFLDLSVDAVTCIVQRGQLNVNSEMELIDAAVLWATARSEEQGTSLSGKAVRFILEETGLFKHLRFLTLTDDQLDSVQILSDQEVKANKYAIYTGSDLPPPASICSISKPRNSKPFLKTIQSEEVRCRNSVVEFIFPTAANETFEVCNNGPINLTDVTVYSQMSNTTSEVDNIIYEEELQVKVTKLKRSEIKVLRNNFWHDDYFYTEDPTNVIATGYFAGTVKYNDSITVPLYLKQDERLFHEVTKADRFTINVIFHRTGKYPLHQANSSNKKMISLQPKGIVMEISYVVDL